MISIIVPVYNSENYLQECLESLRSQDYTDFEVICIDDGSSDNSKVICESFTRVDKRFVFFSQTNQGVSSARNLAIEKAKGDYICFVDSDDVVSPDYLSHLVYLARDGSFPVSGYTRDMASLGKGEYKEKYYNAKDFIIHILNESIVHPNICMMLFKKNIIHDNKIQFVVGCVRNEDTEFYVHYLIYEDNVKVSDYPSYYYRPNPASAMKAPITAKALTSIEASQRMNNLLYEKGILNDDTIVLSNGVLTYAYSLSKSRNKELYNLLHTRYDVKTAMKKMEKFPRLSKRIVALLYLVLGRRLFFKFIGLKKYSIL